MRARPRSYRHARRILQGTETGSLLVMGKTFYLFWQDFEGRTYQQEETYDDEVKVIHALNSKTEDPEVTAAWYEGM